MGYVDGDYIYDTHWKAMQEAIKGNGIYSGFGTSIPSGMILRMAAGTYWANVTEVIKAGNTDKTITNGDASYDRWDLISGKSDGTITLTDGVAAPVPGPPDLPADEIILTMIYVPQGTVALLPGMIYDFGFVSTWMNHSARHQVGADDEISVLNLSGLCKDAQTPLAHKITHQIGGTDQISLTNLTGLSATPQTPAGHHAVHEDGGGDVLNLAALSGLCKDQQTPVAHDYTYHTNRPRWYNLDIQSGLCRTANPSRDVGTDSHSVVWSGIKFLKNVDSDWLYLTIASPRTSATTSKYLLLATINHSTEAAGNCYFEILYHEIEDGGWDADTQLFMTAPSSKDHSSWTQSPAIYDNTKRGLHIKIRRLGTNVADTNGDVLVTAGAILHTADM